MATLSKPLISAAALASAAAVAVATPAIMPSVGAPTPAALSKAAYELATFSDVLSIPPVVWTDVLFGNQNWGGTLDPTHYGAAWAKPTDALGQPFYVNPWAGFCDGRCSLDGMGGVAYMFTDALINGNGNGYDDYENWNVGLVNYFFEPISAAVIGPGSSPTVQLNWNGISAATWYALAGVVNEVAPDLQVPLAGAFWGPNNVSVFYNLGLTITAALVSQVPVVGPVTGNTILAYLGDLQIPGTTDYYQYGLSGALNYWIDLATGAVPFPTASVPAPAAAEEAPATALAATVVNEAPAPAVADEAPAPSVADEAPAAASDDKAPAVTVADEAEAAPAATAADEAPAADNEPAATSADDVKAADAAAAADDSAAAADNAAAADDAAAAADEAAAAEDAAAADDAAAAADESAAADAPADSTPAEAPAEKAAEADNSAAASSEASDAGAASNDSADSAS